MRHKPFSGAFIALLFIAVSGCSAIPVANQMGPAGPAAIPSHSGKIETPAYSGNRGATIFALTGLTKGKQSSTVESMIRVFAENAVPLAVCVDPGADIESDQLMRSLRQYSDAGIIDISLDGEKANWLDADTPGLEGAGSQLVAQLSNRIGSLSGYFGSRLTACVFPYESLNEHNYRILQELGFAIISTTPREGFRPSREQVDWRGQFDPKGLHRLPVVSIVDYKAGSDSLETNARVLMDVRNSQENLGVAVVQMQPSNFTGQDGKTDPAAVRALEELVKAAKVLGEVVTFDGWNKYASGYMSATEPVQRVMPPYGGGTAVVFRLDDVSKGWHEDVDRAIIETFKNAGVPVDCGVISNANGTDSFEIPWLKEYVAEGVAGISVHGYDWTYYQLDTSKSGLTYDTIKFKLMKARDQYLQYFEVSPVALTVPTDYYDETGYRAVEDAGFKIFATQTAIEPHPSNHRVDYYGKNDASGMYRIPTAYDVAYWDAKTEKWGDIVDLGDIARETDACKYFQAGTSLHHLNTFGYSLCAVLSTLDVAAVSIHPSAFVDSEGKIDSAKLDKLRAIIDWIKTFATITTFEQWYNYSSRSG